MSEQSNVALLQSLYAAFNSGDIQTILNHVTPDAEWVEYGPSSVPYFGNFSGRIAEFFQAIASVETGGKLRVEHYIATGDVVVAEGRYTATVLKNSAKLDEPFVHVFTVRNGKLTSWRGYSDTAAVVAAHTGRAASA